MKSDTRRANALLITVNYKGEVATIDFLASINRTEEIVRIDVIVADNASGAENLIRLKNVISQNQNISLMEDGTNRGYFGAAKYALDRYLACGRSLPDWVIVCNNDVTIEDEKFFTKLFTYNPDQVGVIAPRVQIVSGGGDQNPFMSGRPKWPRWILLGCVSSNYHLAAAWDLLSRKKKAFRARKKRQESKTGRIGCATESQNIYAPHGSFLIFSRKYFEAGGYLDDNLFLYGEEISVAEICRALSLPIVFEPVLSVLHNEHYSTGHRISRFSYECQKRAIQYLNEKYFTSTKVITNQNNPKTIS